MPTTATPPRHLVLSPRCAKVGFNADHWTYHLDLVESFLAVFPDKEADLLFGPSGASPFYMSPVTCTPRSRKYVLAPGLGPRQYNFVDDDPQKVSSREGRGRLARVSPEVGGWLVHKVVWSVGGGGGGGAQERVGGG